MVCFFLTKLLTFGILFLTVARAVVVAMSLILGILAFLTSFVLALGVVLVTKLVMSGVLSSIFLILTLYSVFSTTSFFYCII